MASSPTGTGCSNSVEIENAIRDLTASGESPLGPLRRQGRPDDGMDGADSRIVTTKIRRRLDGSPARH